jgi:hypothetical protein
MLKPSLGHDWSLDYGISNILSFSRWPHVIDWLNINHFAATWQAITGLQNSHNELVWSLWCRFGDFRMSEHIQYGCRRHLRFKADILKWGSSHVFWGQNSLAVPPVPPGQWLVFCSVYLCVHVLYMCLYSLEIVNMYHTSYTLQQCDSIVQANSSQAHFYTKHARSSTTYSNQNKLYFK